jgi:hypothetical protein
MADESKGDTGGTPHGAAYYIDLFNSSRSEHSKTAVVHGKFVPWIESKGIFPFLCEMSIGRLAIDFGSIGLRQ